MSQTHSTPSQTKPKGHLAETERILVEKWLHDGITKTEIADHLGRDRSTIYREIKRGTTTQIRQGKKVDVYFADTGQEVYKKNRQNSCSKGMKAFSGRFWHQLKKAFQQKLFKGKNRIHNIRTFVKTYKKENPKEKVPCFKTVYRYIRQEGFFIKPHDLPVMYRLSPRKNKHSRPKGQYKKKLGTSISERPAEVLKREEFGHWEADLVKGKKTKEEPAILTLLERKTRKGLAIKIADYHSQTVLKALESVTQEQPEQFQTITFNNGAEFSQAVNLENDQLHIYFCHAYSSWERGSNENFNKLLREFVPKGVSIHAFSYEDIQEAAETINQRIREVLGLESAQMAYERETTNL